LTVETVVVPAGGGGGRHLSLVAKTQYCAVVVSRGGWYQVTVSIFRPSNPRAWRVTGLECPLISCVMRPVLTAAASAVMHIISADTIEADMILSIRFRYDTDTIIFRSLI